MFLWKETFERICMYADQCMQLNHLQASHSFGFFVPQQSLKPSTSIFLENLHEGSETIPEVMRTVTSSHKIPLQAQMQLLSRVRLAKNFPNFEQRLKCILARLQALSILGEYNKLASLETLRR